jgi:signal transduction histidine kinase
MELDSGVDGLREALSSGRISDAVVGLLEHATVGIAILDEGSRCIFANRAFAQWLKPFAPEQPSDLGAALVAPTSLVEAVHQVLATGNPAQSWLSHGEQHWVTDCYPIAADDRVVAVAVVTRARAPERTRRLETVLAASTSLLDASARQNTGLHDLLPRLTEAARTAAGASFCAVGMGTDPERPFHPWVASYPRDGSGTRAAPRPVGLLGKVARDDQVVRTADTRHDATLGNVVSLARAAPAFLGIPIRQEGQAVGGLFLLDKLDAPEFSPADEEGVAMLAAHASLAIANLRTRDRTQRTRESFALLSEASAVLAESLEYESTVDRVVRLAVPRFCDLCVIHLIDDQGRIRAAGVAHEDNERARSLRRLLSRFPFDLAGPHPIARVLRTGRSQILGQPDHEFTRGIGQANELHRRLQELRVRSAVVVRLAVRGHVLGALSMLSTQPDHYLRDDLSIAGEFGHRAALAVENARLYREACRAAAAKQDLLAIVSHDLRNPLSAFRLGCDVLARLAPPGVYGAPMREHLERMERTARKMSELIDDLLDMGSIESGQITVRKAGCDVHQIAKEAVAMLRPLAEEREIALKLQTRGVALAQCDRHRLTQVFSNLLGNALKVTPRGGKVIVRSRVDERTLEFSISDTGPGITAEDTTHMLERFWTGKSARGGWGLGLFIVKGILDAHGGRLWVRSEKGKGASFIFTLPREGGLPGGTAPGRDEEGMASAAPERELG